MALAPVVVGQVHVAPGHGARGVAERLLHVQAVGADELADRLERAIVEGVLLLAVTIDERAVILGQLDDPPDGLAELHGVVMNEHEWRQREGLDP